MSAGLYLSRARLRSGRGEALSAIAPVLLPDDDSRRAGHAHRLVWLLFQDQLDATRDFLWRDDGSGKYMILSHRPPADPHGLFELETKSFEPALSPGDILRFSLRANPTMARKTALKADERAARKRGKRVDVVMDALFALSPKERAEKRDAITAEAGRNWLEAQGARAGFTVKSMIVKSYTNVEITDHARKRRRARAGVAVLETEGVIAINDPALFHEQLARGFGSAKAFGCGLMLIRRA